MKSSLALTRLFALLLGLVCLAIAAGQASADQPATRAYMIKAAFLYDMARLTHWPSSAGNDLDFCIYGSDPFGQSAEVIDGQRVQTRVLRVRREFGTDEMGSCDILFIGKSDADEISTLLAASQGRSVLTVSELPGFTEQGGMVRLKDVDNRLRFDLNLGAIDQAGLAVRTDALELADSVTTRAASSQVP